MSPLQALAPPEAANADASAFAFAMPQPKAAAETLSRQGLRIGELRMTIRYEDGSELTEVPPLHRLPNAPAWFAGIANLHGALLPVFDPGVFAGVPHDEQARPMLLVIAHGADAAGILIDGLPRRLKVPPDSPLSPDTAPARIAPHVRGAALVGDHLWFELDCAALLDALEQSLSQINGA
ncbi:MAG TPA: chemotaxis protein CheW [Ramlibacter sp.]|uniref:chemotaxis protein CheW n=1 Tax=Ramlibacter sp. TaxID=1917967 RepID=UPI002C1FCD09|nr:chemotaxis protein CheW [Ramlibacter sp.]HVZ46056.1 chemotaxis protein CheW [Ramlibacter sp.]